MTEPSPTQRVLDASDIDRSIATALPGRTVADCEPLFGGGFATVWAARLDDGTDVVVKVGPRPEAKLLRYERDLIAAEGRYLLRLAAEAPEVPVPRVLHTGPDLLVTGRLPGTNLAYASDDFDDAPVRADFGAALARVHRLTGDRFGYDAGRTGADTWSAAFTAMIDELLDDAVDWDVPLPAPAERIRELVTRHDRLLDTVRRPALLHFDGWDGNLLVADGRLSGFVDGERFLYGDPLLDFTSAALFRRIEDEPDHPFVRGYGGVRFDASVLRRFSLYRLHLYLLMTVEMPSRRITREAHPDRYARLAELLDGELTELGRPVPSGP
ncbi:aminoglycoside phosphotransferase family protein [Actinoplanes sichuanensis]|uniref:Phosphotransferase family protein n=1 Tax=Actinoplanes sichuanensis TaxID=512349 RepID=A0ABW4A7I0_9ACTN|nr:aminoglycoside phosphotransferase family protein [Actinoplanes sichuanensis]BEL05202.1 aminoglycoside phosphotransferase family protein [Actinoplanes sichuanensis]